MAADRPPDGYALLEQAAQRQRLEAEAVKHLAAARSRLILGRDARSVFFAVLALRLTVIPDWDCETLETDGVSLKYSPAFVCGLSPDERLGVLVHEVLHTALAHPHRRGPRDPVQWNVACDLAVNPILTDAGFVLPAGRLMPGEGAYSHLAKGLSAEEYYARLGDPKPKTPPATYGTSPNEPSPNPAPSDPGGCGSVRDPKPEDANGSERECVQAVAQAERAARGRGDLPAGLARLVHEVVHPPADWRTLLREFLTANARNDFSWVRPNRRLLPQGLYLPGLHSEELGEVVIAVDTSGSVGERELAVFAREVQGVLDAFDCTVTVLYHDTAVRGEQRWRSTDGPLTLKPVGGGGTSHLCVFERLAECDTPPACVVCLTDLETRFPVHPPDVPVLWAVVGDSAVQPPFGQLVRIGT